MSTYFKSKQKSVILSPSDDFQIHQTGTPLRHVATSDRNFYDRYYFTGQGFGEKGGAFLSAGFGQYPNLGVQDAFFCIVEGRNQHVIRASRHLGDRMDTAAGPLRVQVIEPLRKLRLTIDDNESGITADLEYTATIPAYLEPRQFIRERGRVLADTERYSQVGEWRGTISVPGRDFTLTPENWNAYRDHSWGVRPVGEPEPSGIRQDDKHMSAMKLSGLWNYSTMQFDDFAILFMLHETNEGVRHIEEAVRIWKDPARDADDLGVPQVPHHEFEPGTRTVTRSVISFPDAPGGDFQVECTPLKRGYISVGTGYGVEDDWRHGKYMGDNWVDTKLYDLDELDKWAHMGYVENLARFETQGAIGSHVGHGFHETGFMGPYEKLGFLSHDDVAG